MRTVILSAYGKMYQYKGICCFIKRNAYTYQLSSKEIWLCVSLIQCWITWSNQEIFDVPTTGKSIGHEVICMFKECSFNCFSTFKRLLPIPSCFAWFPSEQFISLAALKPQNSCHLPGHHVRVTLTWWCLRIILQTSDQPGYILTPQKTPKFGFAISRAPYARRTAQRRFPLIRPSIDHPRCGATKPWRDKERLSIHAVISSIRWNAMERTTSGRYVIGGVMNEQGDESRRRSLF